MRHLEQDGAKTTKGDPAMGDLIRMSHSELHATIELLDRLGVTPHDFEVLRKASSWSQATTARVHKTDPSVWAALELEDAAVRLGFTPGEIRALAGRSWRLSPCSTLTSWTTCWLIRSSFRKNGRAGVCSSGAPSTATPTATCMSGICTGTTVRGTGATIGWAAFSAATILRRCSQVSPWNLGPWSAFDLGPLILGGGDCAAKLRRCMRTSSRPASCGSF